MTKYSDAATKAFPSTLRDAAAQREGFDAGVRHALNTLMEQRDGYLYYGTVEFDAGHIQALELALELLLIDLEPSDDGGYEEME